MKNALTKLLTRPREGREEDACPEFLSAGLNAKLGLEQLSSGLPSDVSYAEGELKPQESTTRTASNALSCQSSNNPFLLTEKIGVSNIDSKTEGSKTESNSDEEGYILAPEDRDNIEEI